MISVYRNSWHFSLHIQDRNPDFKEAYRMSTELYTNFIQSTGELDSPKADYIDMHIRQGNWNFFDTTILKVTIIAVGFISELEWNFWPFFNSSVTFFNKYLANWVFVPYALWWYSLCCMWFASGDLPRECLSMYRGIYWCHLLVEPLETGHEDSELAMQPLRQLIYGMLTNPETTEVTEYLQNPNPQIRDVFTQKVNLTSP